LHRRGFFRGAGAAAAASFAASAVVPQPARAASFTQVVDLTHTMSPEFPTFFGAAGIEMQRAKEFKRDGYNMYWWRIVEHAGTHLDAPIHFSEDGASVEKLAAADLVVPLAVIDVTARAAQDPDYAVCPTVAAWR
jgi:kynurenine formamidase